MVTTIYLVIALQISAKEIGNGAILSSTFSLLTKSTFGPL